MTSNSYFQNPDSERISFSKVFLVLLLVVESSGFISAALGFNAVISKWIYSLILILILILTTYKLILKKEFIQDKSFFYPLALLILFFLVSAISNIFIFPKPMSDWLPSLYAFVPILIFYAFYFFRVGERDIIIAFVILSLIISTILIYDRFFPMPFLDIYSRLSVFMAESRRIVVLKNEVIFGIIIVFSILFFSKINSMHKLLFFVILIYLFITQLLIMESRLGFLAVAIAFVSLMFLGGLKTRTIIISLITLFLIAISILLFFDQHIKKLAQMSITDDQSNILVRIDSVRYLLDIYKESYGWGVGVMSSTGRVNNILHSDSRYNIADTGFFSALGQFGLLGLFSWYYFTKECVVTFKRYFELSRNKSYLAAASFSFILGFSISLIPLSFFTQAWSIVMGGVLLYILWIYRVKIVAFRR